MSHQVRARAFFVIAIPLAVGCARGTTETRVSEAPPPAPPPAVAAPGAVVGPPTGWRTLTEGVAPVPIADHPPVTTSGVVKGVDPAAGIVAFEDGRMVKLTDQSKVIRPAGADIRPGARVVVDNVLPVGVQTVSATTAGEKRQRMGTVASVDGQNGLVRLTDGRSVRVNPATKMRMGAAGQTIVITELRPGDEVVVVLAADPAPAAAPGAAPTGDASASPSALPRQAALTPPDDASELMVFRAPEAPRPSRSLWEGEREHLVDG